MAKLIHNKDPFMYSLNSLLEDDDWGYLFSYSFQAPGNDEEADDKDFPEIKKERRHTFSKALSNSPELVESFHKYPLSDTS